MLGVGESFEQFGGYAALSGVGLFTMALLRFAYGAIRDQMHDKDELMVELRDQIVQLRAEIDRLQAVLRRNGIDG